MSFKMHSEYYGVLTNLIKFGKKYSPYKPWPNPTIAVMCIYGWVRRTSDSNDWIEITDTGRELHANALVTR